MCTFANQIKTIMLFKYEKNASKHSSDSLFELSTPNNIDTYINAHKGHFMSTSVFVALQPIKILNWYAQLQRLA